MAVAKRWQRSIAIGALLLAAGESIRAAIVARMEQPEVRRPAVERVVERGAPAPGWWLDQTSNR